MHASTGWKDWASSPVHVSTGCRVRWVLCHCSQPPPRYQLRGYGSAAIAAPGLQRMSCCYCTRGIAAALAPLLPCSQPPPYYQPRGYGGATTVALKCSTRTQQLQPASCSSSGTASALQLSPPHYQSRGHGGAAIAARWRQPTYCSCRSRCHAAPLVLEEGEEEGEGEEGGEGEGIRIRVPI